MFNGEKWTHFFEIVWHETKNIVQEQVLTRVPQPKAVILEKEVIWFIGEISYIIKVKIEIATVQAFNLISHGIFFPWLPWGGGQILPTFLGSRDRQVLKFWPVLKKHP